MRYLGLDVGDKTIGIALSDPLAITAQGLDNYKRISQKIDLAYLIDLISLHHITKVIIGYPLNMNGSIGPQGEKVDSFIKQLNKRIKYVLKPSWQVALIKWDERLTTVQAERAMKENNLTRKQRKVIVDKIAAQLILQNYLDMEGQNGTK